MNEVDKAILRFQDVWTELDPLEREVVKILSEGDIDRDVLCEKINRYEYVPRQTTRSVKLLIEHIVKEHRIPLGFHTSRGLFLIKTAEDKRMAKAACLKPAYSLINRANLIEKICAERENLLPLETEYHEIKIIKEEVAEKIFL